ncbi:MAG TPA: hypothetical protein VLA19_04195, partial [Herpetosiphonaceae bacterium]|nr:hypothetical protein [Herpetosiphonaceae bacterium]
SRRVASIASASTGRIVPAAVYQTVPLGSGDMLYELDELTRAAGGLQSRGVQDYLAHMQISSNASTLLRFSV